MRIAFFPSIQFAGVAVVAVAVLLCLTACGDGSGGSKAPVALETDKASSTLSEAFAGAEGESHEMAMEASRLLDSQSYGQALVLLERLCGLPELTPDQRHLATRSMLTARKEVAAAAEAGDADLQKLLDYKAATK